MSSFADPALSFDSPAWQTLLTRLADKTGELNATENKWPKEQFDWFAETGVLGWVIPEEYGGSALSSAELNLGYELLASACLCTTFVLTQRNGACQRIAGCEHEELKQRWLPDLCAGRKYATVGISHLTTSRQHLANPAVAAKSTEDGYLLNGTIPWVTAAVAADCIVTGATFEDGRQVLIALDTARSGVSCDEPEELLALTASQTGLVQLADVEVPEQALIAGPVPEVMKLGIGGGTGSLTTSALAVGLSRTAINLIREEAERRPDLEGILNSLDQTRMELTRKMWLSNSGEVDPDDPEYSSATIRQQANSLALRSSQAALTATKGRGFVQGHPAERLVREAMFFLVWSCPQPVAQAALREFACIAE
ncbi:MAG: isovaleryl-CoA dehydrogenase [Planctomyces sp.]|nr:isovaleryl-CoA dehydrogenase [Planctomyces sp.]